MLAVLNESLRLYPPVTAGLVRMTPPEGSTIAGHYVAGNVSALPEGVYLPRPLHISSGCMANKSSPDLCGSSALCNEPQQGQLGGSLGVPSREIPRGLGDGSRARQQTRCSASFQCRPAELHRAKVRPASHKYPNLDPLSDMLTVLARSLAYAEMRLILARLIYQFDITIADDSKGWIERQKAYTLWDRIPLNVYLTPVTSASAL